MKNGKPGWNLWLRWVAANAVGELLGLGGTLAVFALAFSRLPDEQGPGSILVAFCIAVASGAIEATLVGLLQWRAMRPWFPAISWRSWWLATLVGALVAYVLGFLPSTLMNLGEQTSQAPVVEPPQWLTLFLAAGLGAVAGAVLSFSQWLVLRRHATHTGWWIPANMIAWLAGMPVVFWGIDAAQKAGSPLEAALLMGGVLFLTGALVGAIHGIFLTRMMSPALPANPADKRIFTGANLE